MSKQLFVDPREMRAPGKIEFTDILENQYQKTVKDEVGNFPREDLIRIYRDTVSYTHLDVYKRQSIWRGSAGVAQPTCALTE